MNVFKIDLRFMYNGLESVIKEAKISQIKAVFY